MRAAWHYAGMQTCISVARVGTDAPEQCGPQSYGPLTSPSKISILNGFAREFAVREEHGAFSLKWIPKGAARYEVDRTQHHLAGEKVLLLHPGQPYEVEFLDRSGTESFGLFFSEPLLKEVLADREVAGDLQPLARSGRLHDHSQSADMVFRPPVELTTVLRRLRRGIGDLDEPPARLEETLLSLLSDLIAIAHDHRRLAGNIPAKRQETRRLLLGRLQRAREMIEDHQGRPPPLDEVARASCLSKFHLLRMFKATFGVSPLEYADRFRVERSKDLLRHTGLSIGQVAERLGYESQSAFAKMFRRHVGMTPRVFRAD
jgi:AraC-like DNA-binding protein